MARRKKDEPINLADGHELTFGLIDGLTCPEGKLQAFLRDTKSPGLRVRVTKAGVKSFVFEAKLNRQTIRLTIGNFLNWSIEAARAEANRLRVLVDQGVDPRAIALEKAAEKAARAADAARKTLTVGEVWPRYMAEGKPAKRSAWKPRYVLDLAKAASLGGEPKKRGKGTTKPGHLAPLMPRALASIDQDVIRDWYLEEAKTAPVQAGRAVAMFSGFLGWCSRQRDLRDLVDADAARASNLRDVLPGVTRRRDAIEIPQLAAWFAGTEKLGNRVAAVYLQVLVLTGARREELAKLTWSAVDFKWHKLTLADKVEDTRTIPLTPYVESLLRSLPRGVLSDGTPNPFVFSTPVGKKSGKTRSKSGRIAEPRAPHADVLADAGMPHVTIHGLRRSFSLLGEAAGAPAGAIAQVMGHKPSATAEGYRPRSIDALRPYLGQIEAFILEKAGIEFDPSKPVAVGLRLVTNS